MFAKPTTGEIREIVRSNDFAKMAQIPIEDLRAFFENEKARENFSMSGMKNLYAAVCEQVVNEYKAIHKMTLRYVGLKKTSAELQLENFFGTDFFLNVTGLPDKESVIAAIEKTMFAEMKQKAQKSMVRA